MKIWQPIETAPKDGTAVLLLLALPMHSNDIHGYVPFESIHCAIGWWSDGDGWEICWMEDGTADSMGCSSQFFITHPKPRGWMPLPHPPRADL